MKRIFILICSAFLIGSSAFAQSFMITSDTANLVGPPNVLMTAHARVTYIGGGSSTVSVMRVHVDTLPGQASYFCWQNACYDTSVDVTPLTLYMNPGDQDNTLQAYFHPAGLIGTGTTKYCFFDVDNPSDSACITFTYEARTIGINEVSPLRYLSGSYPSPADNYAKINYIISSGKENKILVTNLLGSKVKEFTLSEKQGTVTIPTSELLSGIYVYNIIVDGTTVGSRRMIVNHN